MRMLTNKERKNLLKFLKERYGISLDIDEIIFDEKNKIYGTKEYPIAFEYNNTIYPTLFVLAKYDSNISYVVVDEGAVGKILNGADVFRPGIIEIGEFSKEDPVLIIGNNKLLALGIALYSSEEIKKMERGKVIKNIHYYGDKICKWKSTI